MILVDTSIWIDHLHTTDADLVDLLEANLVLVHPAVAGELAVGQLARRSQFLGLLRGLPTPVVASDDEVLKLVEAKRLYGKGLGYIDAMLLTSAMLTPEVQLWTRDTRLARAARGLGCGHD